MQDITDCLSLEAQNVAEARLAAKRAARAEAREIRMKELERQQKEADEDDAMSVTSRSSLRVEERSDKDFGEKGGRPVSSLSAATLASLGGTSSRRGSGDTSISVDTEASIREIKDSLAEVEEKYKRSMVTNAQLDNEKSSLQYQVDTLREVLLELEEELAESRRQYEEKHKECERQKHDQNVLRFQLAEMKDALEQRESLLTKNGIALDSVDTPNGDSSVEPQVNVDGRPDPPVRTTSMEIRMKKLIDERESFLEQIKRLKSQLEDRNLRNRSPESQDGEDMENGTDVQRDSNRQISDLKFKLTKSTQEITALEQNIIRLESQLSRFKASTENAEKVEDELKAEKRRLQRELRTALDKVEELEVGNSHLVKRLEKMKANRSAILSQQ